MIMRKIGFILTLFVLLAGNSFGQFDLVSRALGAFQANKLAEAKVFIDSAYNEDRYKESTRMWYYRGYIYKELYKKDRSTASADPYRNEAISSFKTTLKLDTANEFRDNVMKIMTYITSTLYNDGAAALENEQVEKALKNYNQYKALIREFDPTVDFTGRDIQFKLVQASVFSKRYEESEPKDTILWEQIRDLYLDVLAMDSNNVSANYNLGILYYNQAVGIIEQMDYDMALVKLYEIQEECINLFLNALPYMKKAYELNPTRKETLIGLSGIYFSLNDIEKSEIFKNELEALGGTEEEKDEEVQPDKGPPMEQPNPTPEQPQDQDSNKKNKKKDKSDSTEQAPSTNPENTPDSDVKEKKQKKEKKKKDKSG